SIASYEWNFGDAIIQTTTGNRITHDFGAYNNFNVKVKGISASGCYITDSTTISIAKFPLTATVFPSSGCIPVTSSFQVSATMVTGDNIQNIIWDFGDGSPIQNNNLTTYSHTYNSTNNITSAKVIVNTAMGCTNEYPFPLFAFGTPPSNINAYTVSGRDTFCGSESIELYATANWATFYVWDYGEGGKDSVTSNTVAHQFTTLGNKRVVVTPYFNGCSGTSDTVNIFVTGVIAFYSIQNTCSQKNRYLFQNLSEGNISHYEWTFSDQPALIDSTNFNGTHNFPTVGNFTANLLLIDYVTGCRDSLLTNIHTALPVFSSSQQKVCKDSIITFRVTNSYPWGVGYSYEYNVDGQVINNGDSTLLEIKPTTHGSYADYVVIRDNSPLTCSDTVYLPMQTIVRGPVADFSIPIALCADTAVIITNNSHPFYSNEPITTWKWDFADNKRDSVMNPAPHKYSYGATYNISLTATDINGCGQYFQKQVTIHPLPKIDILPRRDTICAGQNLQLIGFSIDTILWSPNTYINCTNCDTVKVNPVTSTNYIGKTISEFGCKNYDTAFIKVHEKFTLKVSPSDTSICPGFQVAYSLNKKGITTWTPPTYLNNTNTFNPISTAEQDISYKIIVQDSAGCFTDSTTAKIHLFPKASVDAGPDLVLDYDMPFTMSPLYNNNIQTYFWTPAGTLNCTNCANPSGRADITTNYKVQVINSDGCKAEDNITVFINCLSSKLYFPTAFTPNADRLNDYFYPLARGFEEIKSFSVFNRNGFKVFERKNFKPNIPSLGWDGNIRGDNQSSTQTFVWFAEVICEGKTIVKKGTVMLIR
ncbi:MAG: PKD domain-containing protein, partial [Ferruginibacter sp.]